VRKSLGETSYTVRFTPRKSTSYRSAVNIKRAEALVAQRRMKREGLAAFAKRDRSKPARYAFENAPRELDETSLGALRSNKRAWDYFSAQPPSYQQIRSIGCSAHRPIRRSENQLQARRSSC
jgi:uncharacterized protein YdeI (YjbR/CyaY-like superfamily)